MTFDPSTARPVEFDPTTAVPEGTPPVRTVLKAAATIKPDDMAEAERLAKRYPAPVDTLYRNLADVRVQEAVDKADERLKTSPKLAAAMAANARLAAMAQDDIEPLAKIESGFAKVAAASVGSAVLGISEGIWRTPDAAQRAVGYLAETVERTGLPRNLNPIRGVQDVIRFISEGRVPAVGSMGGTTNIADQVNDAQKILTDKETFGSAFADVQTLAQNADKALATAVQTGNLEQIGQVVTDPNYWSAFMSQAIPSLYLAMKSGGSVAFMGWLEGMEQAGNAAEFEQKTGIKISDADFTQAVAQTAIVNALLEKYGLDKVLGAKGNGLKGLAKAMVAEGGTEGLQQVNSNLAALLAYDEGKSLSEGVLASIMGGVGAGGGVSATQQASEQVAGMIEKRAQQADAAKQNADNLAEALKTAGTAALRERSPEQFRALMQSMTDGSTIHIDGEVLNQLPLELLQQLPEQVWSEISTAAATGNTVEIAVADLLTIAPGTPLEQVVVENAKVDPFALSQAEAKQVGPEFERVTARAQQIIQQAEDQDAARAEYDAIHKLYADQLNATSRFRKTVNDMKAHWLASYYTTQAARNGMTPTEFQQRFPLRILGEPSSAGQQVMDQDLDSLLAKLKAMQPQVEAGQAAVKSEWETRVEKQRALEGMRAAMRDPQTGTVYTGWSHQGAINSVPKGETTGAWGRLSAEWDQGTDNTGFIDAAGNFISRTEAEKQFGVSTMEDIRDAKKTFRQEANAVLEQRVEPPEENDADRASSLNEARVSPRMPSALKAAENGFGENRLQPTIAAMPQSMIDKTAAEFLKYPNFAGMKGTPREVLEQAKQHMKDNLRALVDAFPADLKERARMWYVGGNRIARALSETYGVPLENVALAIAALSPQKNWFENVTGGERVIDIVVTKSELPWSSEMTAVANARGWFQDKTISQYVRDVEGKTLRQMYDPADVDSFVRMAWWVRAYDEAHNPRELSVITPEGTFTDQLFTARADGTPTPLRWGSAGEISKAIAALVARTPEARSKIAGGAHKVRSFFNNIVAPYAGEDVTIDTHAVAAALLRPLGGTTHEVQNVLSGGVSKDDAARGFAGIGGSSITGSTGAYGVYADAYRELAAELGILPRELQSITWEAVRLLYDAKGAALKRDVAEVWSKVSAGELTHEQAIKRIFELAGGIGRPDWASATAGPQPLGSSYRRASDQPGGTAAGSGRDAAAGAASGGVLNQSDGFDRFVGDATRVDLGDAHEFRDGEPVVVAALHGTTGDFTTFDTSMANIESDLGRGFYFTNNPADVGENYAGMGPDLTNKIQGEAERLESNDDLDPDEAKRIARDKWMANEGLTMPVWVKMQNPAVLGGSRETFLTYEESYDEDTDEYGEPTGTLINVIEALREVAQDERYDDADVEQTIGELMEKAMGNGGISARELIATAKLSEGLVYATDYESDGKLAPQEILRRAFEAAGFDGFIDQTVDEKFGSASEGQRKYGKGMKGMDADTVHFIAFKPTQIKSRLGNSGAFDESDPDILKQGPRGTFNPKTLELVLNPNANLSTFFHETGHFFLEVMADIASQPNAPAQIVEDMGAFLKWAGVKDLAAWNALDLDGKRKYHERWAESIEQYVMEGRAPSVELQPLMRRFATWLKSVYGSIKQMLAGKPDAEQTPLNDDIRRVMDRMLATDEQIAQANGVAGLVPDVDADATAAERLNKRSMRDLALNVKARDKAIKDLQKQAKDWEKTIRAEVTIEVDEMPVYLAKEAVERAVKETDADPVAADAKLDSIATQYGFTSIDHMAREIENAQPKAEVIDGRTNQRMLEEHGDLVDERAIQQAANEAVHNEARARALATELRAQSEMLNERTDTGETNKRGARITVNALVEAAKQFAANVVGRTTIRDMKSKAWQHTAAERRAAAAWQEATAAGKTADAVKAKQDQVLNNAAAKAALEAEAKVRGLLDYLKKFDKAGAREKLPPEYLDQIDKLLERVDLRVSTTGRDIDRRASLAKWIESQHAIGLDPVLPDSLLEDMRLKSYKEMTYEEFVELTESIKNIEHLGRLKSKLLAAKDKREFDAIANEWADSIRANGGKPRPVKLEPDGRIVSFFKGAWAEHRKLNSLIRQMDGGEAGGPGFRFLIQSMNERGTQEDTALEKATMALADIFAPLDKLPGGLSGDKRFIPEINNSLSRAGRLAIALNWGNAQNRQRVMDGDGWTEAQVNAILGTLSTAELQFVNQVWEHLDSYWPDVKAKQMRVSGVVEDKVEAEPFVLTSADGAQVQMRGGYYPIKYDADRSVRAQINDAKEIAADMLRGAMLRPTTRRGHTKARVDEIKGRPIRKDLAPITQHVSQVVHDLAWHEWAVDANRLLADPRISAAIRDHHGAETHRAMTEAVEAIVVGDLAKQTQIDKLLLQMRANVTRSIMGVSATTALLQPFGLTQSMARIGVMPVLKGAGRWAGDAARMESTVEWIHGKSEFMRLRAKTFNRELREINQTIQGKWKVTKVMDAVLFYPMQKMQMIADVPTWVGMYEKALAEGVDEGTAVALADEAVLSAQGGGGTKDLAGVQRSLPFLTQFYSYFSTTLNLVAEKTALTDFKNPRAVAGWVGDMALLAIIPAILPALITFALKGGGEDDEPEDWAKRLAEWQAGYLLGMFVGLRELPTLWSPFDYGGPPAAKLLNDGKRLVQQAGQGEIDDPAILAAIGFLGTALGLPTTQVIRSYKGWKAWDEGDAPPTSILFGPPPKD